MPIGGLIARLLLAQAGVANGGGPVDFAQRAARQLERANADLAAGRATESLAAAELGLEFAPDSRKLLEVAERASLAAGRRDDALYWSLELRERRADLDPLLAGSKELVDRFDGALAAAAALEGRFVTERLPANAADVARAARAARLASESAPRSGSASTWASAREVRAGDVVVKSDLDGVTPDEIASAMEAMRRAYRATFRPRGEMRRIVIKAYRSRAEFDANEPGMQPEVHGFYAPESGAIALYDPRRELESRDARPFSAFWTTLFHEAAHPYTHETGKEPLPAWLNEGSACFFEGWRYAGGGRVESGAVPRNRLRELIEILDAGRPDLKSVFSWRESGSLPGSHYPVAWALVDFSFGFEDEAGESPYADAYRGLLDSWRNGDDRRDPFARFVDAYVERPRRRGVATFADFEALWSKWMRALATRTLGGAEQADVWLALARRQAAQRRFAAAAESLRAALDHRPGDAALELELARCALELGDKDGAILAARRSLASAAGEARDGAIALLARADRRLGDEIVAADERLRGATLAAARGYAQAGLPRCALRRLGEGTPLLLDDRPLAPLRDELEKGGAEPGRWRRLPVDPAAPGRESVEPMAARYVVEALVEPRPTGGEVAGDAQRGSAAGAADGPAEAGEAFGGVVFGESALDGRRLFAVSERRRLALAHARATWDGSEEFSTAGGDGPVRLSVEVDLAHDRGAVRITCRLDGTVVRSEALDAADFVPCAGIVVAGATVRVTEARWRE
jgi:hypothetical protein